MANHSGASCLKNPRDQGSPVDCHIIGAQVGRQTTTAAALLYVDAQWQGAKRVGENAKNKVRK